VSKKSGVEIGVLILMNLLCSLHGYCNDSISNKNPRLPFLQSHIRNTSSLLGANVQRIENVKFYGVSNFIGIYRHMPLYYPDIVGKDHNLSFSPYPSNGSINTNPNQPMLQLFVEAAPTENTSMRIGYAFFHNFSGSSNNFSKSVNVPGMLQLEGNAKSKYGVFKLIAGGGANSFNMSPLTISNKTYREPLFEKMPWDWYKNAFAKYCDKYNLSSLPTPGMLDNTATQGIILEGADLPLRTGFKMFYGKSNLTSTYDRALADYPLNIFAVRVSKKIKAHTVGINVYNQFGYATRSASIRDNRSVTTIDASLKFPRWSLYSENGIGRLNNPAMPDKTGFAFSGEVLLSEQLTYLPLSLKMYSVDHYVVSLESAVLNSNTSTPQGGYGASAEYDNTTYRNILQQSGMMANNRIGAVFATEKKLNRLKISLAWAASVEKQNVDSVITFEHKDNAYTRSRFNPWVQSTGPYGRIGNRFRQVVETIVVTDNSTISQKGFNTVDFGLNYKTRLFQKELILMNFISYGSIQDGFSLVPKSGDNVFVNSVYEEISIFWKIHQKLTVSSFGLFQGNNGGTNTQHALNDKPIRQQGSGYGFGFDFDFDENAGLFLRHRWFWHKDNNFEFDKFRGTETSLELKIFF
jgi:hypothetical protein